MRVAHTVSLERFGIKVLFKAIWQGYIKDTCLVVGLTWYWLALAIAPTAGTPGKVESNTKKIPAVL
jgi:hypothetical protein